MYNQSREMTHRLSNISVFRRNLRWFTSGLFPFLLLCCMDFHGSSAETQGTSGPTAKRGGAIFQQHCVVCHNQKPGESAPFGPPNLSGIFHGPSAITTKQAEVIITRGKGAMPAWGTVLTHSDVEAVIAYLKTR
jgi:mono/diheme cytochrome c family protein